MKLNLDMARCTAQMSVNSEELCGVREKCARFCQTERDSRGETIPFWRGVSYILNCYVDGSTTAYIPED